MMATYTPNQYADLLDKFTKGLPKKIATGHLLASQQVKADITGRIFTKGEAKDGTDIGKYSTSPTLIGAKSFPTKGAAKEVLGSKKKRSKLEWVKVKGNNLAVLKGGYKEIRRISGYRTDKVDLEIHGDLRRNIKLLKSGNDWVVRIFGSKQIIKARANEERFKNAKRTIFAHSEKEEERANKAFNKVITEYIEKIFD